MRMQLGRHATLRSSVTKGGCIRRLVGILNVDRCKIVDACSRKKPEQTQNFARYMDLQAVFLLLLFL